MRVVVVAWIAAALAACAPQHIQVPPLPPQLTPEQRVVMFQQWRQRGLDLERTGRCRGLLHGCNTDVKYTLILDSGVEITEGDDLLPLLPPASVAGRAAADIVRRRKHQRFWKWFAISTVVAGIVVVGVGTVVEPDAKVPVLGIIGAGVAGGGFTAGYVTHRYHTKKIQRASSVVFTNYDQALIEQLGLCVTGLVLVPCELAPPRQ